MKRFAKYLSNGRLKRCINPNLSSHNFSSAKGNVTSQSYLSNLSYDFNSNLLRLPVPADLDNADEQIKNVILFLKLNTPLLKLSEDLEKMNFKIQVYDEKGQMLDMNIQKWTLKDILSGANSIQISDGKSDITVLNLYDIKLALSKLNMDSNTLDKLISSQLNDLNFILNSKLPIKSIIELIDNTLIKYKELQGELEKKNLESSKRSARQINLKTILALLYFLAHLIIFYLLIYQFYGWDNIEPVTYLVGNIYWIAGILFLLKFKNKVGLDYFFSNSYGKAIKRKFDFNLGFCSHSLKNLNSEIHKLQVLRNEVSKLI